MRRDYKPIIIFLLALTFLSGCKKDQSGSVSGKEIVNEKNNETNENNLSNNKDEVEENIKNEDKVDDIEKEKSFSKNIKKNIPKNDVNLKQVDGATIGSLSSLIEDRQVWNDFVDEEFLDSAKKYQIGIHIPRILLDSEDAKVVNDEIDNLVENIKDTYQINKANMENGETGITSTFSVYQDDNVLSLMIENYDIWDGEFTNFHVYNFSLPEGKLISDEELMKKFGTEEDNILTMVENSLIDHQNLVTKIYSRDVTDLSYTTNPDNLTGLILNDLWDNYDSRNQQIYIDETGRPNFVFSSNESVDYGLGPLDLELRADKYDDELISDEYLRMARGLGIDLNDESNKVFVIYLGGANDEENLKKSMSKLQTWSNVFLDSEEPSMLVAIKQSEVGNIPYLIGEELYLVIPKYKNASISLSELEITEDGKLTEVDNPYLDTNSCSGTTLICQNISDLGPNGKITIRYRDEVVEFSPQLSLKDGSLVVQDGVIDGKDILDWDEEEQEGYYSYIIFERIKYLMGVG